MPLRLPQDKSKYRFFPVEVDKSPRKRERKVHVGNSSMTEFEYFEMVEALREIEFPSMPKAEFQKTGVHTIELNRAFPPLSDDDEIDKNAPSAMPVIASEELPF